MKKQDTKRIDTVGHEWCKFPPLICTFRSAQVGFTCGINPAYGTGMSNATPFRPCA